MQPSTKYEVTLDETGKTVFKKGSQIEKRADDDVDVEVVEEAPKSVFLQEEEAEEERQRQAAAAKAAQEKAEEEARIAAEAVVETEEEKHQREMRELKEKVRKQSTEGQDWSQFMGAGKNMVGRSAK